MADYDLAQAWQPFFTALAGTSATLAGLVFIAVSLHPQITLTHPLMRMRAYVAASGFLLEIVWALIMLLPARTAPLGGLALLAAGIGGSPYLIYLQIKVRMLGLNMVRVVVGDLILLTPVVAGLTGLVWPASPVPFALVAVATSAGFFVLFSQCWTLVLHGVRDADVPHRSEPRGGHIVTSPRKRDDGNAGSGVVVSDGATAR